MAARQSCVSDRRVAPDVDHMRGGPFANGRRRSGDDGALSSGTTSRRACLATTAATLIVATMGCGATAVVAQQCPMQVHGADSCSGD